MNADVIVIGAGPAGSSAAREIAQQGWRVLLVERGAFPGQRAICGGGLEGADADQLGLPERLIHNRIVRREHCFPWGTTTVAAPHLTTTREELDGWLASEAVAAGAELAVSTQVRSVVREITGQIIARVSGTRTGCASDFRSRLAIFADGPHTLARRHRGLGFVPTPTTAAIGLTYCLAWSGSPLEHHEIHFGAKHSRWGYLWMFPKRDMISVGVTVLPSRRAIPAAETSLRSFIAARSELQELEVVRRAGAHIPVVPASRIYDDSMLAVGDAAGMVEALTGAGIANAVAGGRLAGQVACEALSAGDFSAAFLSRYRSRWEATPRYRMIRFQSLLTRLLLPWSQIDGNLYARLMQLLFLSGELGRWQKVRVLAYPLVGSSAGRSARSR
jgi:digeranylgeranylglycerophospholipid reductase